MVGDAQEEEMTMEDQDSSDNEIIDFNREMSSDCDDLEDDKLRARLLAAIRRNTVDDAQEIVDKEGVVDGERESFKVIGQTDVALTCNPKKVVASWVGGSVNFSADTTETGDVSLDAIDGIAAELSESFAQFSSTLFPVQQAVIPELVRSARHVLPPRDFVISAPTGSGKTLCFVLPILNALRNVAEDDDASAVYALVVAPVRDLARQIYAEFNKYNVFGARIVALDGGNDYEAERNQLFPVERQSRCAQAHIIVATPGRLVEHLVDDESGGAIDLSQLRFLVVDEADRMVDTARMEWLALAERRANASPTNNISVADLLLSSRYNRYLQKVLCSATLSLDVNHLHAWNLRYPKLFIAENRSTLKVETGDNLKKDKDKAMELSAILLPKNLSHKVMVCVPKMKPVLLYFLLSTSKHWKKVLVFVNEKSISRKLTLLLQSLAKNFFAIEEISSNLYGHRRQKILSDFRSGKVRVIISSDVMSRGIDVPDIDCVVNYSVPINERIFVHRAGRTARGLASGMLLSLVTKEEKMKLKRMLINKGAWPDDVEDRRDADTVINAKLMEKYQKALQQLKTRCQSK